MANLGAQAGSGLDASDITTGTLGAVTLGSSVVFPAGGTGNPISVAIIAEQRAYNSHGGTYTSSSDSWKIRNLNTEISDPDGIVSISSNQFTLGSGTYFIHWKSQMYRTEEHLSMLYDITATSVLAYGMPARGIDAEVVTTTSEGTYVHAISASNIYEIRHKAAGDEGTTGLGYAANVESTIVNNYVIVNIFKLK